MWGKIAEVIGSIIKAIVSALLNKPIDKKETYHDAKGNPDADDVFDKSDW